MLPKTKSQDGYETMTILLEATNADVLLQKILSTMANAPYGDDEHLDSLSGLSSHCCHGYYVLSIRQRIESIDMRRQIRFWYGNYGCCCVLWTQRCLSYASEPFLQSASLLGKTGYLWNLPSCAGRWSFRDVLRLPRQCQDSAYLLGFKSLRGIWCRRDPL